MQNKTNDTPKVVALTIGILLVIVFGFFQYRRATQSAAGAENAAAPSGTTVNPVNLPGGKTPDATLASSGTGAKVQPGLMRKFDPTLDSEPENGAMPLIGVTGRANSFYAFKAPPKVVASASRPPGRKGGTGSTRIPTWRDPGPTTPPPPPITPAVVMPPQEIALDGVVTGPEGFAVLTIKEGTTEKTTVFKRVGEIVSGQKIVSISEAGLSMAGWKETWLVGQIRQFGGKPVMATEHGRLPNLSVQPIGERTPSNTPPTQTRLFE